MNAPSLRSPAQVLRDLRICFVAGTLGQGGAERQLYYILKSLKGAGSEVSLLSLTKGEYWQEPIHELGVAVEWVGQSSSRLVRLANILKAVRRLKPQVVQSQHFYANTYSAIAARVLGCHDVGAIRNDGVSEFNSNGPIFGRLHLRLPRLLAVNSQAALGTIKKMGLPEQRLFHLPNVTDTDFFQPGQPRDKGATVILGVGRLVAQKRFDRFLRILSDLRQTIGTKGSGIIVGDGPLKPQLEALARQLGLIPDGVVFAGSMTDARPCFQKADILLLTSEHEGTPNVVMEAMACAVPVVSANVGGAKELIEDGATGFLFEPADEQNAVATLERLIGDGELGRRIGQQARQFIARHHSLEGLPQILATLYDQATADH